MIIEDRLVRDLTEKSQIELDDYLVLEDLTGTKLGLVTSLRSLIMDNLVFDNVEKMKMSDVVAGDYCITLGYRTPGDGGAAMYKIMYEPTAVEDGANWMYLYKSDVNRIKFIPTSGAIRPEQFGAYGDGVKDDTNFITKCMDSSYKIEFRTAGVYKITKAIELKTKCTIDLNGCTIKPSSCSAFTISSTNKNTSFEDIVIKNGTIDMSSATTLTAITINKYMKNLTLRDLTITGGTGSHVAAKGVEKLVVNNCNFSCTTPKAISIETGTPTGGGTYNARYGVYITDSKFTNCTRVLSLGEIGAYEINAHISNIIAVNDVATTAVTTVVFNSRTSSGDNMRHIVIDNVYSRNFDSIINNQAADCIVIRDVKISCAKKLFDSSVAGAIATLEGSIILTGSADATQYPVFGTIAGTLNIETNCIKWSSRYKEREASNSGYTCKLFDHNDIYGRAITTMSVSGTSLAIPFMKNGIIEISNTGSITAITGGIENQVIGLKATSSRTISNAATIALNTSPVTLSKSKMILLKCTSGKWTEI